MCCKCCSVAQRMIWVFGIGTILLVLGIVMVIIWPNMSEKIVESSLKLKPGSSTYDNWMVTPIPVYTSFTLFNWTNPEEIRNPDVKPNVVEMGPYVYLQKTLKEDIDFHDNYTVSFYERKTWIFQPEMSGGTLEDMITSPYAISAAVADLMRDSNKYVKKIVNFLLNKESGSIYTTQTSREWIFDGFDDGLLEFLNLFNTTAIDLSYTKFGWLADRNGTKEYEGKFMMNTGVDDIQKIGDLTHWNGSPTNGFYPGECGRVNGSFGDMFPPKMDTTQHISVYTTDTCRFLNLSPTGKSTLHGLEGVEWSATVDTLDSGQNNPDQECFCNPKEEVCPKAGVVDSRKCRDDAPIYTSFPHFYLADSSFVDGVTGLNPNQKDHEFKFIIEPNLGIPLVVNARIQYNLLLQPDEGFDLFKGLQRVMVPLFFFEQVAELSEDLAKEAKLGLNLKDYGLYFAYALIGVGALVDLIGIILTVTKRWKSPSNDKEILLST